MSKRELVDWILDLLMQSKYISFVNGIVDIKLIELYKIDKHIRESTAEKKLTVQYMNCYSGLCNFGQSASVVPRILTICVRYIQPTDGSTWMQIRFHTANERKKRNWISNFIIHPTKKSKIKFKCHSAEHENFHFIFMVINFSFPFYVQK